MSWLAVFLGGNRLRSLGQSGRAMLLSSSATNGLRLRHRDSGKAYVWYSDQFGQSAMAHYEVLEKSLKAAGVPSKREAETIRAIFPPST